jgi:hypothetical protein
VLLPHRDWLNSTRPDPSKVEQATTVLGHASRNHARGDTPVGERDEVAYIRRRRREIDSLPVDHDHNLRAAGIDPDRYRHANGPDRDRLRGEAERALHRERTRLAAAPTGRDTPPTASELAKARATFASADVRAARREQTRALRAQRRQTRQPGRR